MNRFAAGLAAGLILFAATQERPNAAPALSNDDSTIVHVLNRIAFGPRPGDVARVQRMGLERYIDEQLHPERIADAQVAQRLEPLATTTLTSREIAEQYAMPAMKARGGRANVPLAELSEQKIVRAIYSERQLEEVLVDFWFNHFNVDARKGVDRFLLTEYERDAIRPHVLGSFRDLLEATAKSPAMLFYLDNWMNGRKGLNENYGRELMELHTLGVDGGYTQKDVTEVARAFTGWTIQQPRQGGPFRFEQRLHDAGEKVVLGHRIRAGGGIEDGEEVLDMLASHPSTARFIASKLTQRFVSDTPAPALVDRVAARFTATKGDLREVMRTLLTSPEFFAPDSRHVKVKTPLEFVVSAVRSIGVPARKGAAPVPDVRPLVRALQQLGMPLYQCQPPTGYRDSAEAWVNTGALVNRMNFALQLAKGDQELALKLGSPEFQRQ